MPLNSIYHRCPVKQCTFKTLRSDDAFNFLSIMDHIKVLHNDHFIVFNRTRFSPNDIQESLKAKSEFFIPHRVFKLRKCENCGFWYRSKSQLEDHYALDCDINCTYPETNYRLDALFDLSILQNDYGFKYHGVSTPRPESSSLLVNSFWATCHICTKTIGKALILHLRIEKRPI